MRTSAAVGAFAFTVLAAAAVTVLLAGGVRTTHPHMQLSPHVTPAVQRHADCVNQVGPAMDPMRGWVKGGDVLECRATHLFIRARVYLWYWDGAKWVQAGSAERTAHNTRRVEVATRQRICGWPWAPYWKETAEYTVADVGSFHHETGYPGYNLAPYMHPC